MPRRGPHRTPTQREGDLAEIARLDRLGYSQEAIGKKIGVDHSMVSRELDLLRQRYRATQLEERGAKVAELLEGYRDLMVEAVEAWERSKQNAEKLVTQHLPARPCGRCKGSGKTATGKPCGGCGGKGRKPAQKMKTYTSEGQVGNPAFLERQLEIYRDIRELLGLDAPQKKDVRTLNVDWESLFQDERQSPPRESVEEELDRLAPRPEPPQLSAPAGSAGIDMESNDLDGHSEG